ncbi:hypothetical protein LMG22931_01302 [Paraburkholderia nemoris]|nr:hypothetical protein LMG22931_01302 [Paraburkholderia nemoris]
MRSGELKAWLLFEVKERVIFQAGPGSGRPQRRANHRDRSSSRMLFAPHLGKVDDAFKFFQSDRFCKMRVKPGLPRA